MGQHDLSERVNRFWLRVTEGMQLSQLWSQFRADAHSSYRLYSREVDSTRVEGVHHGRHFLSLASSILLGDCREAYAGPPGVISGRFGADPCSGWRMDVAYKIGNSGSIRSRFSLLRWPSDVRPVNSGSCRSRCDEARPADCQGDPNMATSGESSPRPGTRNRIHHASCQYRCRRLL